MLRSNRSAAHAKLMQFHAALADADVAVALRPDWGKGHGRRGAALLGLRDWARAQTAFRNGLLHDSSSSNLKQGLQEALEAEAKAGTA